MEKAVVLFWALFLFLFISSSSFFVFAADAEDDEEVRHLGKINVEDDNMDEQEVSDVNVVKNENKSRVKRCKLVM